MSTMVETGHETSINTTISDLPHDEQFQHSTSSPAEVNSINTHSQEVNEKDTMPEMKFDPFNMHIKKEPEEKGYPDVENSSSTSEPQRPETSSSLESDSLEAAMTPRYHRARYFRRNYSSPECAVCEVCQAEFGGPDLLRLHKLAHFNTASVCYVCDSLICDTNGESLGSKLMLHMTTHHKAICIPSGNYKPEAERAFVCPICLQRFSSNKILTLHTLKQHNQSELTNFTCKICSMDFISARALHTHLLGSRHKDMKIKVQSIFMCVDCRAVFPARDSYAMHMMMRAQSESCSPLEECVKAMMREKVAKPSSPSSNAVVKTHTSDQSHNSLDMLIKQEKVESSQETLTATKEEVKYTKGEFICELCNLQFFHPDTLNMHRKMMHLIDETMKKPNGTSIPAPMPAPSALTDIIDARSLMAQNAGMSWTCIACGYDFDSCDSLAMHVMDQHSGDLTIPVTSSANRIDQSKIASSILGPILTQMMYKPPSRKLFENAAISAMVSSQLTQNKMPNVSMIAPHSVQSFSDITLANNISKERELKRMLIHVNEANVEQSAKKQKKEEIFSCVECQSKFENESDLDGHKKTCGSFYSKCSFCHVSFHDKGILLQHLKHCNPETGGDCTIFGEELKEELKTLEHNHKCQSYAKCLKPTSKTSPTVLKSEEQMQLHFEQNSNCRSKETNPNDRFGSPESTQKKDLLSPCKEIENDHNIDSKNTEVYSCKHCSWSTYNSNDYTKHIDEQHHGNDIRKEVSKSPVLQNKSTLIDNDNSELIESLVQDAVANKRNKRKLKPGTRVVSNESPETSLHSTESGISDPIPDLMNGGNKNNVHGLIAIPVSPEALAVTSPKNSTEDEEVNQIDATGHEHMRGQELLSYILSNAQSLIMCKYCHIIYTDRTMYYLHMGLHNLNNPWQCNLCGKVCANVHEFSSHVIHYR